MPQSHSVWGDGQAKRLWTARRYERRLTQEQLARLVKEAARKDGHRERLGIDQSTISAYERGVREPLPRTILYLSQALAINEHWLLTGKGPMDAPYTIPTIGKL